MKSNATCFYPLLKIVSSIKSYFNYLPNMQIWIQLQLISYTAGAAVVVVVVVVVVGGCGSGMHDGVVTYTRKLLTPRVNAGIWWHHYSWFKCKTVNYFACYHERFFLIYNKSIHFFTFLKYILWFSGELLMKWIT